MVNKLDGGVDGVIRGILFWLMADERNESIYLGGIPLNRG